MGTYKSLFCSKNNVALVVVIMWGGRDAQTLLDGKKNLNFMHLQVVGMPLWDFS